MKEYTKTQDLKEDWYTVEDLENFLLSHGYSNKIRTIHRWELTGIIPKPKRAMCKKQSWRVYDKEGKDFEEILVRLEAKTTKRVNV